MTLIIGTFHILPIPIKIVEVIIALSILLSAIHSLLPIFGNRASLVALLFGFFHGLAFSETLQNLQLGKVDLLLSVFGFNVGIELIQLLIIVITIPWFILILTTKYFTPFKNVFAVLTMFSSMGWIMQRISDKSNWIVAINDIVFLNAGWLMIGLSCISVTLYFVDKYHTRHQVFSK